jgi:hypothetical protein
MSTANIKQIIPVEGGCIVTFETRTQGDVSYFYSEPGATAILHGDDPAQYDGVRM